MSDERLTRDVVSSNDNRDPHRHDPSPRMARPFIARGWMIPSDLVYPGEKLDKAGVRIQELESQLADAKRNEERAVGELESSSNAIRAHCDLRSVPYSECHLCGRIEVDPHPAYECPRCEVKDEQAAGEARLDTAEAKLHTLEAAVRELQRWSPEMDGQPDLSRLYALVPEVGA